MEFTRLEVRVTGLSHRRVCVGEISFEDSIALPAFERSVIVEKMELALKIALLVLKPG